MEGRQQLVHVWLRVLDAWLEQPAQVLEHHTPLSGACGNRAQPSILDEVPQHGRLLGRGARKLALPRRPVERGLVEGVAPDAKAVALLDQADGDEALKGATGNTITAEFVRLAGLLDAYNNGLTNPGHCSSDPVG